jgi:hypothetical protein
MSGTIATDGDGRPGVSVMRLTSAGPRRGPMPPTNVVRQEIPIDQRAAESRSSVFSLFSPDFCNVGNTTR